MVTTKNSCGEAFNYYEKEKWFVKCAVKVDSINRIFIYPACNIAVTLLHKDNAINNFLREQV